MDDDSYVRKDDVSLWLLALSVGLVGWAALWLWLVAPTKHLLRAARFLMITWLGGLCVLWEEHGQWRDFFWSLEFPLLQLLALDRLGGLFPAFNENWRHWCLVICWLLEIVLVICAFIVRLTSGLTEAWGWITAYVIGLGTMVFWNFMSILSDTDWTLRKSLQTAREEANATATKDLRAARTDSLLQWICYAASFATSATLFLAICYVGVFQDYHHYYAAHCVNCVVNVAGILLFSHAYKLLGCGAQPPPLPWFRSLACSCAALPDDIDGKGSEWVAKTWELAGRGIVLVDLLAFYKQIFDPVIMSFEPAIHTTNDVVRLAIIPLTSSTCSSYAELVNKNHEVMPHKMVTHNWSNLFRDLVAAVVSDALEEHTFDYVSELLSDMEGTKIVERALLARGESRLLWTYWICAFSVNQHAGICGTNPNADIDPVTNTLHPTCACATPKFFNKDPPLNENGESIHCEMNKFDDMMALLARNNRHFSQVVAVDANLNLFGRAWCIAELAEAHRMGMDQKLTLKSKACLLRRQCTLQGLQVQKMQASRPEDVQAILAKIPDTDAFNRNLQKLIFNHEGLLATWKKLDVTQKMEKLSHVVKWAKLSQEVEDGALIWRRWLAPADF
eukprot:Skav210577  [mRNA]  locus=scaffold3272:31961:33814:- [translate_table: standard]